MLNFFLFTNRFLKFVQSGAYLDFFFKKVIEIYLRNVFIYTSQFFGEKYFIEVLTKKIIDKAVFNSNKYFNLYSLEYSTFLLQAVSFLLYSIAFVNVFFYFL